MLLSSPLRRTLETAEAVAASLGLPIEVEDGLPGVRLRRVGRAHARPRSRQRWPDEIAAWLGSRTARPPGGESVADVQKRVEAALASTLERVPREDVVVVSHVNPIKLCVRYCLQAPWEVTHRMLLAPGSLDDDVVLRVGRERASELLCRPLIDRSSPSRPGWGRTSRSWPSGPLRRCSRSSSRLEHQLVGRGQGRRPGAALAPYQHRDDHDRGGEQDGSAEERRVGAVDERLPGLIRGALAREREVEPLPWAEPKIVTRTARPTEAPTCCDTLTSPEAAPASRGSTACSPAEVSGTNAEPLPRPSEHEWSEDAQVATVSDSWVSQSMLRSERLTRRPAARSRSPNRSTSTRALACDAVNSAIVTGRKPSPVFSGP